MKTAHQLLFYIGFTILFLGCNADLKRENATLKDNLAETKETSLRLQQAVDSLKGILAELQQTDIYYYQSAVDSRSKKKYDESTQQLRSLIEKFPRSSLIADAKKLISSNDSDAAHELYERAKSNFESGNYHAVQEDCQDILAGRASSELVRKVQNLLRQTELQLAERKAKLERAGADLELLSWSWRESGGGYFVEAQGQVKNISGRRLENVEALVTFMTKGGTFITSASALIDYDPILPGQTSPFKVIETRNPAMSKASIEFKFLLGGTISTYQKGTKK